MFWVLKRPKYNGYYPLQDWYRWNISLTENTEEKVGISDAGTPAIPKQLLFSAGNLTLG